MDAVSAAVPPSAGGRPQRRPGLVEQVADLLRTDIITGAFAAGERLTESRLATHYGVSRVPVREAMRLLEGEGFVHSEARGIRTVAVLDQQDARDVFEVRATVEGLTAGRAAERAGPEERARISALCAEGQVAFEAADLPAMSQLNTEFHRAIALASGSPLLLSLVDQVSGKIAWLFRGSRDMRAEASWAEHAAIAEAIARGDVEAARAAMTAHITNVRAVSLLTGEEP
jgi:DNA-binding GntR family transcriptional regulator